MKPMEVENVFCEPGRGKRGTTLNVLWADQRGQSSTMIAMTAVVFIALLAFMANIGQAIHDKMLTQAVADAAALSAADVQAIGMNEIADLHAEINKLVEDYEMELEKANREFLAPNGYSTYFYYKTQIDYAHRLIDEANRGFAVMARQAAQKIVEKNNENYRNLHPKVSQRSHKGLYPIEPWSLEEVMGEPYPNEMMGKMKTKRKAYFWREWFCYKKCSSRSLGVFTFRRNGVQVTSVPVNLNFPGFGVLRTERSLHSGTNVYTRIRVKRKPVRALVDMENYGFGVNLPEIVAYSQAQPNKGNIKDMKPIYEARLAPLWQRYPNETTDSEYLNLQDEFKH